MHQQRSYRRSVGPIVLAACVGFSACDANPTSPDEGFSFNAAPTLQDCSGLTGSFSAPTIVVFRDGQRDNIVTFIGTPALLVTFNDGRFTSNVFATGLPSITNVGSFSISGGFVVFGERPFIPRLLDSTQRFNCQLTGTRLVLVNEDALFDFGSGRSERARVRVELSRRQP